MPATWMPEYVFRIMHDRIYGVCLSVASNLQYTLHVFRLLRHTAAAEPQRRSAHALWQIREQDPVVVASPPHSLHTGGGRPSVPPRARSTVRCSPVLPAPPSPEKGSPGYGVMTTGKSRSRSRSKSVPDLLPSS